MTIHLRAGDWVAALEPETGGAMSALTWRGVEVLRGVVDTRLAAQRGRAIAAYPLVPFANRIAFGRFRFAGQDYQLARNFGDHPHTIHGNAWMHPWRLAETADASARMVLEFSPAGALAEQWPFAYRAEQAWELTENGLSVAISVCNTDARAAPVGVGLHPYLARTPQASLGFEAASVWLPGVDGLPTVREQPRGECDFGDGRRLGETTLDACYTGWTGSAVLHRPENGMSVVVSAPFPMRHLQVYTPQGRDFIGLEPVSNMPDAINRMQDVADQGIVVLQPGESLDCKVTIAAS